MNKRIRLTIGIGLVVLLLAAMFATAAFAQGPGGAWGGMMGGQGQQGFGGMMSGRGFGGMMGGQGFSGMMGGQGQQSFGGMMSGQGQQGFGGMMGYGSANPADAQPITIDQAAEAAQQYLKNYNNADPSTGSGQTLKLAEVMEFDDNFYAVVTERSTGIGAFELLVDRYTGYVTPEHGPNMMWNSKYGPMAGQDGMTLAPALRSGASAGVGAMMGQWKQQTGPMAVTVEQARAAAQQWLDANQPGAKLADDEMQFYGHYTMDFLKDGKTAGMLSVNGYTGQVWYHTWHGNFISEQTF